MRTGCVVASACRRVGDSACDGVPWQAREELEDEMEKNVRMGEDLWQAIS